MRSTSDVIFGVTGQTLRHCVRSGRPTSATFEVFADTAGDDDTAEFSGTATVDSVSTTLSAAAGASQTDPTALALTSAASVVVGRTYLLSEDSKREWVRLVALDGSTATVNHPLANNYTTAATFVSTDITAAIDATWVADESNLSTPSNPEPDYRVRWEILYSGSTLVELTFFDLVRGSIGHGVTMEDLRGRLWSIYDRLPIDDRTNQGQDIIDDAWEDVQAELAAARINDGALRDGATVDQFLIKRILLNCGQNGVTPLGMSYADVLADYQRFYERHVIAAPSIAIATSTGAASRTTVPKWRA